MILQKHLLLLVLEESFEEMKQKKVLKK